MKIESENWPIWMKVNDSIAWLELKIPDNIHSVTRCDRTGMVTSKGKFWKIQHR